MTLFNAPQLFYSRWLGHELFLAPVLALRLVLIPSFWWFFPQALVVSSHICTDQYSAKDLRGAHCISLELSLCSATSPPVFISQTLATLASLNSVSSTHKTARHCQVLPALSPQHTAPVSCGNHRLILFISLLSGITVIQCLKILA